MKHYIIILLGLIGFAVQAQSDYIVTIDTNISEENIYDGKLPTAFFHHNSKLFQEIINNKKDSLQESLINALEIAKKEKLKLIIVGGVWWCRDTRSILPKLVLYTDSVRFKNIDFYSVGKDKKSRYKKIQKYKIKYVPTIIIYKDNTPLGRIVEYGKTGNWEKELSELLLKNKR